MKNKYETKIVYGNELSEEEFIKLKIKITDKVLDLILNQSKKISKDQFNILQSNVIACLLVSLLSQYKPIIHKEIIGSLGAIAMKTLQEIEEEEKYRK